MDLRNFSQEEYLQYITQLPISRSSRLLLAPFNASDYDSDCKNPVFNPDNFQIAGTVTIVKINNTYFALCPLHTLYFNNSYIDPITNKPKEFPTYKSDMPFLISERTMPDGSMPMDNFLYPKSIWLIGELINQTSYKYIDGGDMKDLCLIELSPPAQYTQTQVQCYIDLSRKKQIIRNPSDLENAFMGVSGHPFSTNLVFYEQNEIVPILRKATHSIALSKYFNFGINSGRFNMFKYFENRETDYNGMCGGVVFKIIKGRSLWAGIYISGSENTARYIPSYLIYPAILKYKTSQNIVLDKTNVSSIQQFNSALNLLRKK